MKGFRRKVKPNEQNVIKFNVDGASRGKPEPAGLGGVLRNHEGTTSIDFNESVGTTDSNEVEILNIRRILNIWNMFGQGKLIIEGDSTNAIKWVEGQRRPP